MNSVDFCLALKNQGFNFFAGVPCSILKDVISYLQEDKDVPYVSATREDEAIGIATGSFLGGQKPVVLMQNSGLGNSIGALASLPLLYKIPMLLVVSWRGYQGKDAPEHVIMGEEMLNLLDVMKIPYKILEEETMAEQISGLISVMEDKMVPVAAIVRKGLIK